MKTIIYRSTYKQNLGEFLEDQLTEQEQDMFYMLWGSFMITHKLKSAYFELMRVGDGKYTLQVQKYVDESWSAKFTINERYGNMAERYT